VNCLFCGKELSLTQTKINYGAQKFCSRTCYIQKRKLNSLWFNTPEMIRSGRGHVSRSKKGGRKEFKGDDGDNKGWISWRGIYTKKQVEAMKAERNGFKSVSVKELVEGLKGGQR